MIFISKMICDPNQRHANRMGVTIGLVFYTPKFWDCQSYDFYVSQFDEMRGGLTAEEMERRFQDKLAHRNCKRKHMSYRGYMYWVGPKRRYDFRYMGPTHSRFKWWKPFSVSEHGRYVRWRDDGPQNEPRRDFSKDIEHPAVLAHRRKFREAMQHSRQQMQEYERVRGGL